MWEGFSGGAPAQDSARPMVDGVGDGLDLGCAPAGDVGAFGEVLPEWSGPRMLDAVRKH